MPDRGRPIYFSRIAVEPLDDPKRLIFVRDTNAPIGPLPKDITALEDEVDTISRTIVQIFEGEENKDRRKEFFGELHRAADLALRGTDLNVESGESYLKQIKDDIASKFPAVRDSLWWRYLASLGIVLLTFGGAGGIMYYAALNGRWGIPKPDDKEGIYNIFVALLIAILWIPLGAALGIFVEFVLRIGERDFSFEELQSINPGRWKPIQRSINITFTAYILAFLMGIRAFQIGVGTILLNEFITTKPFLSIAVGLVTGLAFPYVRDVIQQFRPIRVTENRP
jgi:hypothetical protein